MRPLYSKEEFENSKSKSLLPLECSFCHKIFHKSKGQIQGGLSRPARAGWNQWLYCSHKCHSQSSLNQIVLKCITCGKSFSRIPSQAKRPKNPFCSHSCSATYNNLHKKHGNRRSKLELWIESELKLKYPSLEFLFNSKMAIGSELDIYIPKLQLAFELNGIYHYEPIHGLKKLSSIQKNDICKFKICSEKEIELCIIDVSSLKYYKISNALPFLEIITSIINQKMVTGIGFEPTT